MLVIIISLTLVIGGSSLGISLPQLGSFLTVGRTGGGPVPRLSTVSRATCRPVPRKTRAGVPGLPGGDQGKGWISHHHGEEVADHGPAMGDVMMM